MKQTLSALLLVFLLSCHQENAPRLLEIAFIDTTFCVEALPAIENITIAKELAAHPNAQQAVCARAPSDGTDLAYHGHFVLKAFLERLKELSFSMPLHLRPINVFDSKGVQTTQSWQAALASLKERPVHLTITALGLPDAGPPSSTLPSLTLAASGTVGNTIRKDTRLWPQELTGMGPILVGSYWPLKHGQHDTASEITGHYDTALLNFEKTRFYVARASEDFGVSGTSWAVARAAARLVHGCATPLLAKDREKTISCLEDLAQNLRLIGTPGDQKNSKIYKALD